MRLEKYANALSLYTLWERPLPFSNEESRKQSIAKVLAFLLSEKGNESFLPETDVEKERLLRALLNVRKPLPLPDEEKRLLDRLLWNKRIEEGIVNPETFDNLWQGDITRLKVDAIVNAANCTLLGCMQPLHYCIDNAIHSAAGPQLRSDCHTIMQIQRKKEATGGAKITRGYNLPSRFVLHTVGPIVKGCVTKEDERLLTSCYHSCLTLAVETQEIRTLAFCCISTGVFGYPQQEAAQTAINAVREWEKTHSGCFDQIIFNVFTEEDYALYRNLLSSN